jgi:two-component system, chemotaxis family, chemotaxis protein CheY
MRVLIADDQRSVGLAIADMVRCCGHQVVALVGSGLEAINAHSLHKPDLVLMDYRMPKFNGGTACRHIIAKDPVARVILLSAWSPLDVADQSGALSFLPKPIDFERLNTALQNVERTLPPEALAEESQSAMAPIPEVVYQPQTIDYFPPIAQPEPIDYFQPVIEPISLTPRPSEFVFPIETPPIEPIAETTWSPIVDLPLPEPVAIESVEPIAAADDFSPMPAQQESDASAVPDPVHQTPSPKKKIPCKPRNAPRRGRVH